MKRIFKIALVIIVTTICIMVGAKTRYNNGIRITQFEPQLTRSMGYMLETVNNKLIMIDGGLPEDSSHVEQKLLEKGGVVEAWFITHAHDDHYGVLVELIKSGKVQINNIYVSFNSEEWYETYNNDKFESIKNMLDLLDSEEVRDKVHEVNLKEEIAIDNLFFKILKIKSPEHTENPGNNQSVVIKVSNNIRSMIFLGDLGSEYEEEFLQNNLDEIEADAVQMAHHGQAGVSNKIYNAINPKMCFWPTPDWLWNNDPGDGTSNGPWKTLETRSWIEKIGATNYVAKDGDITVNIY